MIKKFTCLAFTLLFIFYGALSFAQTRKTVTGTVNDPEGNHLAGVSVSVKGGNALTSTDVNGHFSVSITPSQALLVFSYLGFAKTEIDVSNQTTVAVTLKKSSSDLTEVTVTALGIKREKKALGYAATRITTDKLQDVGSPINAFTSLYGQAPGVQVTGTALGPGGGINIRIRNAVSMNDQVNTMPLFVIDGIPMVNGISGGSGFISGGNVSIDRGTGTGLNDLNIDDIESFDVLKGAKASVLYGAAGGNGVILITTKSGKNKPGFGVEANLTSSVNRPWVQQKFQNEFGSGFPVPWGVYNYGTQQDAEGFYLKNGKQAYAPTGYNFGPKMDGRQILWYDGVMRPYSPQPNNINEIYQNGYTNSANIAVAGGGPDANIRFSYTHDDYKGIFLGYKITSNNFNLSANVKVTNRVRLKLVSTYNATLNHNSPAQNQNAFVTYGLPRQLNIGLLKTQIVDPASGYNWFNVNNRTSLFSPGGTTRSDLADKYFWDQTQNSHNLTRNHYINSLTVSVDLAKGLSLDVLGGFDMVTTFKEDKNKVETPLFLSADASLHGIYSRADTKDIGYNGQAILSYNTKFGNDFSFYANLGGVAQRTNNRYSSLATNGGFVVRDFFSLTNSLSTNLTTGSSRGSDRLYGALGSAQIGYKDWLFVEFSGRNDWTSILPPQNNSYFYPGVSASWIFSEALKMPSWLSYGKLRSSFADLGTPGPRYFGNNTYTLGNYGGVITFSAPGSLAPVDLKPEKRRELEIGIETKYLKNRIGLEFNYYHNTRYNSIIGVSMAASTGADALKINAGKIVSNGLEVQLTGTPVLTKDFQWNITLNASKDRPVVKKLYPGITVQTLTGSIGSSQGATVAAPVNRPWGTILVHPYATDPKTGQRLVGDDGLYYTDQTKTVEAGNVLPSINGGLINNFRYKNFSLQVNMDYQFGSRMFSLTNMYMMGNGSGANTLQYRDAAHGGLAYYVNSDGAFVPANGAVPANAKFNGTVFHDGVILPGVKTDGTPNNTIITAADKYSYYWRSFIDIQPDVIYKNDYIKVRNVVLSYQLPAAVARKLRLQRLSISAFANNLFYIHKTMPNVDPESFSGTSNVYYENSADPSTRSFGATLRASF
ncbi:SusC/RagA family TonB-linked outer membrane protein [Mucilaginibacter sp. 22184]|uniref:SusC/RagA family TonB-linked outer membrane protein n=1 Tax=Mucilaginibacter sp. 22184 TaxID=3453887 RepID=UPI003F85C05D